MIVQVRERLVSHYAACLCGDLDLDHIGIYYRAVLLETEIDIGKTLAFSFPDSLHILKSETRDKLFRLGSDAVRRLLSATVMAEQYEMSSALGNLRVAVALIRLKAVQIGGEVIGVLRYEIHLRYIHIRQHLSHLFRALLYTDIFARDALSLALVESVAERSVVYERRILYRAVLNIAHYSAELVAYLIQALGKAIVGDIVADAAEHLLQLSRHVGQLVERGVVCIRYLISADRLIVDIGAVIRHLVGVLSHSRRRIAAIGELIQRVSRALAAYRSIEHELGEHLSASHDPCLGQIGLHIGKTVF